MKAEAYEMLAAREGTYWWHRARRVMVRNLLRKYGLAERPTWLDLGSGPGGNLTLLDSLSPALVVGADISPIAREIARHKASHASLVGADIAKPLPFADGSFDVVTVFNEAGGAVPLTVDANTQFFFRTPHDATRCAVSGDRAGVRRARARDG